MIPNSPQLKTAIAAATAAGRVLHRFFDQKLDFRIKSGNEIVSDADFAAETAAIDVIRRQFPDHGVLSEETHQHTRPIGPVWIIDPLDGTTNFAHHIPHFAVSIAFMDGVGLHSAVVYNPISQDWFIAERGQGAFHNDQPVTVSSTAALSDALIATGFYYDRGAMMRDTLKAIERLFDGHIRGIRRNGVASLDLCWLGCGRFDGYFEYRLGPWDYAAGALFVTEAGGRVTDEKGDDLLFGHSGVLASNGRLHGVLIDAIERPRSVFVGNE